MAKKKLSKNLVDYGGGRGAAAGDDLHQIWGIPQALRLFVHDSPLTAITVEGVQDRANSDTKFWDGVDCAYYFGGTTIQESTFIEIEQLKYSGSDPDKSWTVAELTANSATTTDNSVFRRLADAFKGAR